MKSRFLYLSVSVVGMLILEFLLPQQRRPELAFGLCFYFVFFLPSEEALYLCLLCGLLKDALSVETFGLFIVLGVVLFLFGKAVSFVFKPTVVCLLISFLLAVLLLRLVYAIHIIVRGYSAEGLFNYSFAVAVVRSLVLLFPLYLLLVEHQEESRKKRLYSEKSLG